MCRSRGEFSQFDLRLHECSTPLRRASKRILITPGSFRSNCLALTRIHSTATRTNKYKTPSKTTLFERTVASNTSFSTSWKTGLYVTCLPDPSGPGELTDNATLGEIRRVYGCPLSPVTERANAPCRIIDNSWSRRVSLRKRFLLSVKAVPPRRIVSFWIGPGKDSPSSDTVLLTSRKSARSISPSICQVPRNTTCPSPWLIVSVFGP
jgi:hypothetical protein